MPMTAPHTDGELEKILDELIDKLPIKTTEIGWEKVGEDVQEAKSAILSLQQKAVERVLDLVEKEVIGNDEVARDNTWWCNKFRAAQRTALRKIRDE